LSILEQAAFIDELKNARQWDVADIAAQISRSKAWVSVRLGLIARMSEAVPPAALRRSLSVYSFM